MQLMYCIVRKCIVAALLQRFCHLTILQFLIYAIDGIFLNVTFMLKSVNLYANETKCENDLPIHFDLNLVP